MGNYFNYVLSEEQMAAYLDGMLSAEESNMIEELIDSNSEMVEIQDAIDAVDLTYLYETNYEIPIECMADDFSLPDIGYEDSHNTVSFGIGEDVDADNYNEDTNYLDNPNDIEYQDEDSESGENDSFMDDGFSF